MAYNEDQILDTDLLAATGPDGVTYSVTGAQFKTLFAQLEPLEWVTEPTIDDDFNLFYSYQGQVDPVTITEQWYRNGLQTSKPDAATASSGTYKVIVRVVDSESRVIEESSNEIVIAGLPWENHSGVIFHIVNPTGTLNLTKASGFTNPSSWQAYEKQGENWVDIGFISQVGASKEVVFLVNGGDCENLFKNNSVDWQFGEYTDTSNATKFSNLFRLCSSFSGDISDWDTGRVSNMYAMCTNCDGFVSDLPWDVSSVRNLVQAFEGCANFNGDVTSWNPMSCSNFYTAFKSCPQFNQDISGWDVSEAVNMQGMLAGDIRFKQDLSGWCVPLMNSTQAYAFAEGTQMPPEYLPVWGTCP